MDGISAVAIHGNKSQPQRVRALNDFKRNKVAILVATDIAARGLDIESLPHVVNYELPMVASDYVHRIGRTGRAGTDGDAISLVCVDEHAMLREIERLLGHRIEQEIIPGFTPDRSIRPQLIQSRGSRPAGFQPRQQPAPRQRGFGRPGQTSSRPAYGQSRPSYGSSRPAYGGPRPPQGSIGRPMSPSRRTPLPHLAAEITWANPLPTGLSATDLGPPSLS